MWNAYKRPGLLLLLLICLFPAWLNARPWLEIKKSGILIVISPERGSDIGYDSALHRVISPFDMESFILEKFALENRLEIRHIVVKGFDDIFPALDEKLGDIAHHTIVALPERQKKYTLSKPYQETREIAFTWTDSPVKGTTIADLVPFTAVVQPNSSFENAVKNAPFKLKYKHLPYENMSNDDIVQLVASKKVDYSVMDEVYLDAWMAYNKGIRKICDFPNKAKLVFAAPKGSDTLIQKLNAFIDKTMTMTDRKQPFADLDVIKKRGYIRVLTKNDPFCYFMNRGAICGFEFELIERFAEENGLKTIAVIPPTFADLTTWLEAGKGDIIAANYTLTEQRKSSHPDLIFCAPYLGTREVLCGRLDETITSPAEVKNRKIYYLEGASYGESIDRLRAKGASFTVQTVNDYSTPQIIRQVQNKKFDLAIGDELFLNLAINSGCRVKMLFPVSEQRPFAWIVRSSNPQLAAAVNNFFAHQNKSAFFNVLKKKYYSRTNARKTVEWSIDGKSQNISPYDDLFKKYGKMYGFKWYFLVAQSYQESHFNPKATNHYNARGLMQVLPKTAREMGIAALEIPENGIHAGAKYMAKLYARFGDEVNDVNKLCFSLAAYNAGYGHLTDARKLAAKMGYNPNVWKGNVERAMELLSEEKYYSQTKFGYCRSEETIPYVLDIMARAVGYEKILALQQQKKKK